MVTLNAGSLNGLLPSDPTVTNESGRMEQLIDLAIHSLNIYGASLSNLSGNAGSKSGTYTSKEAGAILMVAVELYSGLPAKNQNVSETNIPDKAKATTEVVTLNPAVMVAVRDAAAQLNTRNFRRA